MCVRPRLALTGWARGASRAGRGGLVGALGEVMDYRLCVTLVSLAQIIPCYLIMWRGREDVKKVYNKRY